MAVAFSGDAAFLGPNLKKGADVALAEIDAAGGVNGSDVQFVTADTGSSAEGATTAVQKLLKQDDVDALIGPTSVTILSVLSRIQASKVPDMVIASTSALDDAIKGETTFRATPSDTEQGPAEAYAAYSHGARDCAIVAESLEGAQSISANVKRAFEGLGGQITREINVATDQSSYRSEILKLVQPPLPDCVFYEISPGSAGQWWQDASEFSQTYDMLWMGNDVSLNEDAIKTMKPVESKLDFIAIAPAAIGPGRDDYVSAYQKKYPDAKEPVVLSDLAYDAMNLLALAAEKAGSTDQQAIADNIVAVSRQGAACTSFADCKKLLDDGKDINYEGASGSADISDNGNSVSGYGVFKIAHDHSVQTGQISQDQMEKVLDEVGVSI
jgi:ABC-type branched-subunit amino acid transport system substrate-binding protein